MFGCQASQCSFMVHRAPNKGWHIRTHAHSVAVAISCKQKTKKAKYTLVRPMLFSSFFDFFVGKRKGKKKRETEGQARSRQVIYRPQVSPVETAPGPLHPPFRIPHSVSCLLRLAGPQPLPEPGQDQSPLFQGTALLRNRRDDPDCLREEVSQQDAINERAEDGIFESSRQNQQIVPLAKKKMATNVVCQNEKM